MTPRDIAFAEVENARDALAMLPTTADRSYWNGALHAARSILLQIKTEPARTPTTATKIDGIPELLSQIELGLETVTQALIKADRRTQAGMIDGCRMIVKALIKAVQ